MVRKQEIILMHREGKSNREIAAKFHMSKNTVNKYTYEYDEQMTQLLEENPEADNRELIAAIVEKPAYDSSNRTARKVTEEVVKQIKECLDLNEKRMAQGMSKQRMLKKDIHKFLTKKGIDIGYSTVKTAINKIIDAKKEAFIRQEYEPGDVVEFDWGTVKLNINNTGYKKYYIAVFTSAFCNYRFAIIFKHQDTVAFQESHVKFFDYCKGVFRECVYDNMRVAVRNFVGFNEKEPTEALLGISLYYGFKFRFTNIYKGNEKGHVEKSVDVIRNEAFAMPGSDQFPSLEAANEYLLKICDEMNADEISNKTIPADEFKKEEKHLLPCPPNFECCIKSNNKVDKYSTIVVNQNHYSVPDTLVGKEVGVKMYSDTVCIYHGGVVVATHNRSRGQFDWVIDIMHYLRTLAKKPGALKRSSALLQADAKIKKLYEKYYSKDAKAFLQVLEIIKERGVDHVMKAVKKLEGSSPTDISYDKVKIMCDCIHENAGRIMYLSDHLTEYNRSLLPQYDNLFITSSNLLAEGGVPVEN